MDDLTTVGFRVDITDRVIHQVAYTILTNFQKIQELSLFTFTVYIKG